VIVVLVATPPWLGVVHGRLGIIGNFSGGGDVLLFMLLLLGLTSSPSSPLPLGFGGGEGLGKKTSGLLGFAAAADRVLKGASLGFRMRMWWADGRRFSTSVALTRGSHSGLRRMRKHLGAWARVVKAAAARPGGFRVLSRSGEGRGARAELTRAALVRH
jgi:hypothetical protein